MKPNVPLFSEIKKLCSQIEKEEKIKILFAVENGSRAWRMESENSDYDVRFVFCYQLDNYLSLRKPRDVIERFYDKKGNPAPQKGCYIDIVGFDVFKYLNLLAKSNPTAIEWLVTDIVYHGKQNEVFRKEIEKNFNPNALIHHYKSLCKQNYLKYLKSGNLITYKKYLYSFRGLINAKYVQQNHKLPPISFIDAVKKTEIPKSIEDKLESIIEFKKSGKEKEKISGIKLFDSYIESFLKEEVKIEKYNKMDISIIEKELKKVII